MSGHTKGPWEYRNQPHDDWGIVRAGRYLICQARSPEVYTDEQLSAHRRAGTDPWEANARLISAAPELLALLAEADRRIAWESVGLGNTFSDRVEAAIAKAEGRA
ncbi:hypothetical protein [Novosphingobium pentaromativorans]|uniref:Uncharacterized protein n=1 Tax=Novosphingobium pentaromativorans US6-1 TaxID=1088721 RepID=G6E8R4_9SPHN|nr:hypothetical protein [Novosphingobium pentaromativorans]AIT81253.1 hypothetical protein JI59_16440 [Novosphingobium pentaromativorans US6-1]EHJ62138.1 hypothetical protein NSU_0735 [Novosphingobium pentaromativorans US6-1]